MIERTFIVDKIRDLKIKDFLEKELGRSGYSKVDLVKTPLGMKVLIHSSKPGLIVGRKGANIKRIQAVLKDEFDLDNPKVEIEEVIVPELDAKIMAEQIASYLERLGVTRFKAIGHRNVERIMRAGALGAEIIIAGKVPGKRATSWRFYKGYLPKCGDISDTKVEEAYTKAMTKPGIVGVTVRILPPGVKMPDNIIFYKDTQEEEVVEEEEKEMEEEKEAVEEEKEVVEEEEKKVEEEGESEEDIAKELGELDDETKKELEELEKLEKEGEL